MGRAVLWSMTLTVILCGNFQPADSLGELSVTFHYWIHTGAQCDFHINSVFHPCDPNFAVVVSQRTRGDLFQHMPVNTEYVNNKDAVIFESSIHRILNPIRIRLAKNTGSVTVELLVYDVDDDSAPIITHMTIHLVTVRNAGDVGYLLDGVRLSYSFKCDAADSDSLCLVQCTAQDDDINGHYTCGSAGEVVCRSGWMGADSGCKVTMPCGQRRHRTPPCGLHGKCKEIDNTNFICHCFDGYWGSSCENHFKPCESEPCKNGGTCRPNAANSDFACDCTPGLIGTHCETDKHRCTNDLCQNGGTCIEFIGGFACTCAVGFAGANCQIEQDQCALLQPCVNGGTCENTHDAGGVRCRCPGGVTGDRCQEDIDECQGGPPRCSRGQDCLNTPGSFACVAADGDNCAGIECSNGGTCVDREFHYVCQCLPGFSGPTCSVSSHHKLMENL